MMENMERLELNATIQKPSATPAGKVFHRASNPASPVKFYHGKGTDCSLCYSKRDSPKLTTKHMSWIWIQMICKHTKASCETTGKA